MNICIYKFANMCIYIYINKICLFRYNLYAVKFILLRLHFYEF